MVKFLVVALVFVSVVVNGQEPVTFLSTDSITSRCYLTGDWDQLIKTANLAFGQKIDYKKLRQRIGYAYFVKGDYYRAQINYEKALGFDETDVDTHAYLYYCGINTGNEAYARIHAKMLPMDLQKKLSEKRYKPVDAIDLEYNYKANDLLSRSNPTYIRMGINSQLGYRLTFYQSVSNYKQTLDSEITRQPEYFALLNWSLSSRSMLNFAYHFLNTSVSGFKYPGNLFYSSYSTKINRITLGINGSILNSSNQNTTQLGITAGITLPGKQRIYLKSFLNEVIGQDNKHIVFTQNAGLRLANSLWAEGNITLGNLKNCNDHNALYIYNSIDPSLFRTGLTIFWYTGIRIILFGNSTYEKKETDLTNYRYKQQSFSGGIIWKL